MQNTNNKIKKNPKFEIKHNRVTFKAVILTIALVIIGITIAKYSWSSNLPKQGVLSKNHIFDKVEVMYFLRITVACILGCCAGAAHVLSKHTKVMVGIKTYGAVALGAAAFTSIYSHIYLNTHAGNPVSVLQNLGSITTGIGFLCGAVIFKDSNMIRGLSTAATIWTTAAIGTAVGTGLFGIAILATILVMVFHLIPSNSSGIKGENNKL